MSLRNVMPVLLAGGSPRSQLNRLLKLDGATVANYQPGNYTGTLAASAWANSIGAAPSLAQATGGNQPIILPYAGSKYSWMPGVAANYLSTPNATANRITGDIDIRVIVALDKWSPPISVAQQLLLKDAGAPNRSYMFYVETTGTLVFFYTSDGSTTAGRVAISSVANSFADGSQQTVRVTYASASGNVNFYYLSAGSWVQIGTTVTITSGALALTTASVGVGANGVGSGVLNGKVYRAQIYNGIDGTLAVDFKASDWPETSTNGATQVSGTTGETWTLNNTGTKPAQIVGSPSLLFDSSGSSNFMATGAFTLNQPTIVYSVLKQISWGNGVYIWDGSAIAMMAMYQGGVTPQLNLNAGAGTGTNGNLPTGQNSVVTAIYNGASSSLKVDGSAAATGNAGANNAGAFVLGHAGNGTAPSNIQVKEIIIRNVADSAAVQAQIRALLKSIHGTP